MTTREQQETDFIEDIVFDIMQMIETKSSITQEDADEIQEELFYQMRRIYISGRIAKEIETQIQ